MEVYLSEEERVEALKRWWKENGQSVVTGVLMGALIVVGWNIWQQRQLQQAYQASGLYQQMLEAMDAKKNDSAGQLAERIVEKHPATSYALYARLFAAKLKVDAGDLVGARKFLDDALAQTKDQALKHIVRIRLGRVLLAQGEYESGLVMIKDGLQQQPGEYQALYQELRGDLLLALQRKDEAREAYQQARNLGNQSRLLEMKLDDLSVVASAKKT